MLYIKYNSTLTTLICADCDDGDWVREGAHFWHTVEGLDLKGVIGVCWEVHDSDRGIGQT